MTTTPTKPEVELENRPPSWPVGNGAPYVSATPAKPSQPAAPPGPSHREALQALLAFSALHEQVRRRRALAARPNEFDTGTRPQPFDAEEQFVLDDVLQLVAERGVAITGADGLAIALA